LVGRWQKWGIGIAIALLVTNGLVPDERRELSRSSWGTVPDGHRALHELLGELDLGGERSLQAPHTLRAGGTLWWLEPDGVCDARIAVGGLVDILDDQAVRWPATDWIEGGGRAVVFLEPIEEEGIVCDAVSGYPLPERRAWPFEDAALEAPPDDDLGEGDPHDGDRVLAEAKAELKAEVKDGAWPDLTVAVTLEGPRLPTAREIPRAGVSAFEGAGDWIVAVEIAAEADAAARPFILTRRVGAGELVVVADVSFARNERLDAFDAAPLVVDLVRAWGSPKLDERAHGFVPEASAIHYIARSPARGVFVGLALLGGLFAWWGTALPARSVPEHDPDVPSLDSFVRSLSTLYARTGDHTRVLERYRELSFGKLRRHYGMSAATSETIVVERLRREQGVASAAIERIRGIESVSSPAELRRRVAELDELVGGVTG
jgi:hypothetical protein